jgi:hypothetical protein
MARKTKKTDAVIRDEYVTVNVPADEVARTPEVAEEFRRRVNARISADEQFGTAQEFADYLVNMRRRGSEKGGLPKIRGGHGPGGRESS